MKTERMLRTIVNSEPHVKKVVDRLRYLTEKRSDVDPRELPEETPSRRTAAYVFSVPNKPPSTIESGRVEWTPEETEAIQEALKDLAKCPCKAEIQQLFTKNTILKEIYKANTSERIKNKVKNEFHRLKK